MMIRKLLVMALALLVIVVGCRPSGSETDVAPLTPGKLTFAFFFSDSWQRWARMMPIVNGLEAEFYNRVEFLYLNVTDGAEGQAAFTRFALPGHPGYLILLPDGFEAYRGVGVLPINVLRQAIEESLLEAGATWLATHRTETTLKLK
jgi:hypothetical protein